MKNRRPLIKVFSIFGIIASLLLTLIELNGQDAVYSDEFPLRDVVLLDGPFKHARELKAGDEVQVLLPMHNTVEQLPNVPEYIAFMHGPVLLGAKTGTEDLKELVADDSRWGQIPSGRKLPVDIAPIIIENDRLKIVNGLIPDKVMPLTFTTPALGHYRPGLLFSSGQTKG
jgi:hypothetical protein